MDSPEAAGALPERQHDADQVLADRVPRAEREIQLEPRAEPKDQKTN
jgi:hypothetical protein